MCGHAAGQTYDPMKNKLHCSHINWLFLQKPVEIKTHSQIKAYNTDMAQMLNWPSKHLVKPMIPDTLQDMTIYLTFLASQFFILPVKFWQPYQNLLPHTMCM